jgi:hypothetical protein
MMKRFRAIVAILLLISTMPLVCARADTSIAAVDQHNCCRQKTHACCEGAANACCATDAPASASLFPLQDISPLVLPPSTVPVVHSDRIDMPNALLAAVRLPEEYSPPGLMIVGTTILRI